VRPRHNCLSLEGLDPSGKGIREFWVEKDLIQFFYKKGWMHKYLALHSVKEILLRPAVIFQGLARDGQEEALCYAGIASHRYTNEGHQVPPPPGMTFAVYIRPDDVVFRWDWERADKNLTYPLGYQTRFGPQLWPKT
jgi:hypothetical protein